MSIERVAARSARVEWPTLALLALTYAVWACATGFAEALGLWLAVPLTGTAIAMHSSLQHEVIHGHPTRVRWLNEALVFPAIGIFVPYARFRALHLAHHYDPLLTDPLDDPESNYLDPQVWARLGRPARLLLGANNTLLGRMLLGPFLGLWALARSETAAARAGDRSVARAWGQHLLALVPVIGWLATVGTMPVWAYLLACWVGMALLRIRTFLEHQAHERAAGRSVIIEDRGPLALLFLNNNLHAVHHAHPGLPWYRLPDEYAARRSEFLRRNGGYRYRSYAEVFALHLFRRKDPVAHPIWSPDARRQPH
jgi:fatty acid desaturase